MKLQELLQAASRHVVARDAEVLLAHSLGQERVWLRAHSEVLVGEEVRARFQRMIERRVSGEPLQYLVGQQEFFGIPLSVGPGVLIPRPETELLVEAVLEWAKASRNKVRVIADVGTGTGAIAIALAKELPETRLIAIDNSQTAIGFATRNAEQQHLTTRIIFSSADLLEGVQERSVDVVVSNPPYIPVGEALGMQKEVVEHEPHAALFAGRDGLEVYRRLIPQAHNALRQGGLLAMEIGWGQLEALGSLLEGWSNVRFENDYSGIPRVVLAQAGTP